MKDATISIRTVGQQFGSCAVVRSGGEVVHETDPVPYGMGAQAIPFAATWCRDNGYRAERYESHEWTVWQGVECVHRSANFDDAFRSWCGLRMHVDNRFERDGSALTRDEIARLVGVYNQGR